MPVFVPLGQLGPRVDVDQKFVGLRDAAIMGLRTPPSVYIRAWNSGWTDCVHLSDRIIGHFESSHGLSFHAEGLCVRFGDKFRSPKLPHSICFIGALNTLLQEEHQAQLAHYVEAIGAAARVHDLNDNRSCLAAALQAAAIAHHEAGIVSPEAIVQLAIDTVTPPNSAYGVAYTRHPRSGEDVDFGRYMHNVSGYAFNFRHIGSPMKKWLPQFSSDFPEAYWELRTAMRMVEAYYESPRFIEFAVRSKELWILQITRRREQAAHLFSAREIPDEWRSSELTLDAVVSSRSFSVKEVFRYDGGVLQIHSDVRRATRLAVSFCLDQSSKGYKMQGNWSIFLKQGAIPNLDYRAGKPVVLYRARSVALVARQYFKGDFDILYVPHRRAIIAISRNRAIVAVVGTLSPLVLRYAIGRLFVGHLEEGAML